MPDRDKLREVPARLKLIIAYDGAAFAGWQSQVSRNTVQDHLEHAFKRICHDRVSVLGAGRTDAGVHALGQCAHVDLSARKLTPKEWQRALNATLPATIQVLRCQYVPATFHARFSAKGKIYRYRVWCGAVLPPLELHRAWHIARPINLESVNQAAALFCGTHDFAAFAANRGKPEKNTIRTILDTKTRRNGQWLSIEVIGDGFLYKMVRLIVGAIIGCGLGKRSLDQTRTELQTGRAFGARITAPAGGLFLVRVRY